MNYIPKDEIAITFGQEAREDEALVKLVKTTMKENGYKMMFGGGTHGIIQYIFRKEEKEKERS